MKEHEDGEINDEIKNIVLLDSCPLENSLYSFQRRKRYLNCTFLRLRTLFDIPKGSSSRFNYNVVSLTGTPHSWGGFRHSLECYEAVIKYFFLPRNADNFFEYDRFCDVRMGILVIDWVDKKILINPRDKHKRMTGLIMEEKKLVKSIIESSIPDFLVEVKKYSFEWIPERLIINDSN